MGLSPLPSNQDTWCHVISTCHTSFHFPRETNHNFNFSGSGSALFNCENPMDHRISSDDVGQGKLYSPDHAIKISEKPNPSSNLALVKDKVLEKLAAASVPSESLENAKQFLEGVIKDFAGAVHGMTKDALHRIKTHLADLLPSLSPAVTGKIVDDAEKEAINGEEEDERDSKQSSGAAKLPYVSPTSSSLTKPFSKL